MEKVNQLLSTIDAELRKYEQVRALETKTQNKVRPAFVVVGVFAVLFLFVLAGWLDSLICNLIGFGYPAYASFKAIESNDKEDDTQWLVYWVVFAFFTIIEYFANTIMAWFPFYFVVKYFIILWLWLPVTKGALFIYVKLSPFLGGKNKTVKAPKTDVASSVTDAVDEFMQSETGESLKKFGQGASEILSKKDS